MSTSDNFSRRPTQNNDQPRHSRVEVERPVEQASLPTRSGIQRSLTGQDGAKAAHSRVACVHQLFEAQAEKRPDAIALTHEGQSLSYRELNGRANRLANYLRELGVRPDARVAICMERGVEMVVAMLATLKAGGAYVPLDPAYPAERLAYMLEDSAPAVLLTQEAGRRALGGAARGVRTVDLDGEGDGGAYGSWSSPDRPDGEDGGGVARGLAYIIYTSGSTGLPKGVMVEHRGLVNLICWYIDAFKLSPSDRTSCVASFGFDAAALELWSALCGGATLFLASAEAARDPELLLEWWQSQPLDVGILPTPAAEFAFARGICNPSVRMLLTGGDQLRRPSPPSMTCPLVNNYGPTETTILSTSGRLGPSDEALHIGRPISNTQTYILDSTRQPAPIGVSGELYVGGAGVARGYLNRPELTAERFQPDPFSHEPGARFYKTGDLVRWLSNGNIDFLGRNDFQVKIRGFRIELGEIEAAMASHPGVRDVIVLAHENGQDGKRLIAYYTGQELGAGALRDHLSSRLPEHMMPAAYLRLESLPLTPNGKLDRRALPDPAGMQPNLESEFVAPQTETERELAEVWREVLGVERVGVNDNIFDLGGNSLLLLRLQDKLQARLRRELRLVALFKYPTVSALARYLNNATDSEEYSPDRAQKQRAAIDRQKEFRRRRHQA